MSESSTGGRRRYSFDIGRAIATWRQFLVRERSVSEEDLKELEAHLRDEMAYIRRPGMSDEEVYRRALQSIGDYASVGSAYREVFWDKHTGDGKLAHELRWRLGLLGSYVKTAWRGIVRHKAYAGLNLAGLSVALATCLVIGVFIFYHLSFDRFLKDNERIVRIEQISSSGSIVPMSPPGLADRIIDLFPEAEIVTELDGSRDREALFTVDGKHFQIDGVLMADEHFLDVFSFEIARGDTEHPLSAPGSIVLTESTAKILFDDADPIGKTIRLFASTDYTVTAIAADPPTATQFRFNALAALLKRKTELNWDRLISTKIFVKLVAGALPVELEIKLNGLLKETGFRQWEYGNRVHVQPITRIHLYSSAGRGYAPTSDIRYLILFGAIGLVILSIACINYMNLATARASRRAREVGVRKVVGATRVQLAKQFLGEAMLLSVIALPLAILIAYMALPAVNSITGQALTLGPANHPIVWSGAVCLLIMIGVIGGSYPALLLSSFRPTTVFKGQMVLGRSHSTVRKLLVGIQVIATFALIVATLLFTRQMDFIRTKRLGFDQSQIITFNPPRWNRATFERFKGLVLSDASIAGVTSGLPPGLGHRSMWTSQEFDDSGTERELATLLAGYDYVETMGLTLLEGRPFSEDHPTDQDGGILLTRSFAEALKYESSPVGQPIDVLRGKHVVGVVEDIRNASFKDTDILMAFELNPERIWYVLARIAPNRIQDGLQTLETAWNELVSDRPFDYEFLDEQIQQQYSSETRLARIFGLFAGLSVFVACLGLFGLAAFTAEQRTREIGIRKALGATVGGVVYLLSRDFVLIVLTSVLLVTPVVYIAGARWLDNFKEHIQIGPGLFISATVIALGFVLLAVGYQSVKAALANPADALRHE